MDSLNAPLLSEIRPRLLNLMSIPGATRLGMMAMLVLYLGMPCVHADIYKYVDERGVAHYTNRPLGPEYRLILRAKKAAVPSRTQRSHRQRFETLIAEVAKRYALEPALVHAVISVESGYNPDAESKAGAIGLMQLMPDTALRYGVIDRRDPNQNVSGGVQYLKDLLARFETMVLALAAYNAGENAVIKHGNQIPPYPETQDYVRKVLTYYRNYADSS